MNAVPPKIRSASTVTSARLTAVILALGAVGAAAIVFFFNPATAGFYPICQFHRVTGLYCPGCGATRALYALLHGNLPVALHDNVLFVAGLAAFPLRGAWYWRKKNSDAPVEFLPGHWFWLLLFVALVFTILRNVPAFSFLAPV